MTVTGAGTADFGTIVYNKPGTYEYILKEKEGEEPGYTYDKSEKHIAVTVEKDGDKLKASYTVDGKDAEEIVFTNRFTPAKLSIPVEKKVTGKNPPEETFSFVLSPVTSGAPMPGNSVASITGAGEAVFGQIVYYKPGTFEYLLTEKTGSTSGYTYDTEPRHIVVSVEDDSGTLKASWTVNDETVEKIVFTNNFALAELTIPVKKTIPGEPPADAEFSFGLAAVTRNAPMPDPGVVTIIGEGEAVLGPIVYSEPGIYDYLLAERDGGVPGYTYDTVMRRIRVTVERKGDDLVAKYTVNGEEISPVEFINPYAGGDLIIRKRVVGDLADINEEFTFTVTFSTGGAYPYSGSKSGVIASGGSITLKHGEAVVIYGIPAGCEYTVKESGGRGYRVYSSGTIGKIQEGRTAVASFTNSRSSVPATGEDNGMRNGIMMMSGAALGMLVTALAPGKRAPAKRRKKGAHEK